MNLYIDIRCKGCGFIIASCDLPAEKGMKEVKGSFTLKMQPSHTCSCRYSLLQKNEVKVEPLPSG